MSIFTHVPETFEFEYQEGHFTAKTSFWQNTLDKSCTTFVLELEGYGEYGEVKIKVNTDDWVADAIEAVREHTLELALRRFAETGDIDVTESLVEAVTEEPEEEISEAGFDEILHGTSEQNTESSSLPFPSVSEDEPDTSEDFTDEFAVSNSAAVEDVDVAQSTHNPNSDPLPEEEYGYSV